jgi:hypothetical protein
VGQLGGDGVAGGSAVDADGGAGFHEFRDGPGDCGLLGLLDGGAGTVGGGAADGGAAVDAVQLPGVFEFGQVAADGHAGHAEPLDQVVDVDLPDFLQHPDDVALTHAPSVLDPVDLRHTRNATGAHRREVHRSSPPRAGGTGRSRSFVMNALILAPSW